MAYKELETRFHDAGDTWLVCMDTISNRQRVITELRKEAPSLEGRLMLLCIERWGMVAGQPDGEDRSGRAKIGLMPVDELVSRAAETAAKAVAELRQRGWMQPLPSPEEIYGESA